MANNQAQKKRIKKRELAMRHEAVAALMAEGLSLDSICQQLEVKKIVNPKSGEPYNRTTIYRDMATIQEEAVERVADTMDEHRARQLNEIQEARRQAWQEKDLHMIEKLMALEMKLLGTAIKKIEHSVDDRLFEDAKETLRAKLESMAKRFDGNDRSSSTED